MKLYTQYLGILSSIEYVNPSNLFTTKTSISPYDYTLYEVKNDGLLASCEFKSFEFKNGVDVDSSLAKFIVGLSGDNVVVDNIDFITYLDKASVVAKLTDVALTLSDINTVISAGVSRLLPKTKAGNIVFKINLYGHRIDTDKPSQIAVWHSRGHPETYIVIPEREKEEPIDRLNDTVNGATSSDYIDALDWKCNNYHYKTIIIKNTGSATLNYKVNVYSYLNGNAHEEVAETALTAGSTAEINLNNVYAQTVVRIKDAGTQTTYRIDYFGTKT